MTPVYDGVMIPSGLGSVMSGYGYTVFDTAIGRCGIAWGDLGIVGVQLPEAREIDTRRRMYRLYPEAREQRPPLNSEIAIEGIVSAAARRRCGSFRGGARHVTGIPNFNQRVYQFARAIPRGETRTYDEIASSHARAGRRAFGGAGDWPQPLHDHRALPSRAGSRQLHRQDLAEWRRASPSGGCSRSRALTRP